MLETNIHPTAIISPKATLEEGVKVGPYSLIGEDRSYRVWHRDRSACSD